MSRIWEEKEGKYAKPVAIFLKQDMRYPNFGDLYDLYEDAMLEPIRNWLANHAHVTGPAFYDTAHWPDFFPAFSKLYLNFALES